MRRAGKELLSLALMDSRNHTLRWIAACERALGPTLKVPLQAERNPGVRKAQLTRELKAFFSLDTLVWLPKFRYNEATGHEEVLPGPHGEPSDRPRRRHHRCSHGHRLEHLVL